MTRQSLTDSMIDSMIDSMQQYSLLIWSAARIESDARSKLSAFRGIISCPLSSWHSVQNRNYKSEKILLPQEKTLSRQAGRQTGRTKHKQIITSNVGMYHYILDIPLVWSLFADSNRKCYVLLALLACAFIHVGDFPAPTVHTQQISTKHEHWKSLRGVDVL